MQARFHQPGGSAARRRWLTIWVPVACTALTVLLCLLAHYGSGLLLLPLVLSALVAIFTAPFVERRRQPVDAELELLPGRIVVRDRAGRVQATIRARSIIGATTALLDDGVSLVLAQKPARSAPTVLRLADEASADAVRRALGIGPGGFGSLQWSAGRGRQYWPRVFFRVAWRVLVAAVAVMGVAGMSVFAPTLLQFVFYVGVAAVGMRLTARNDPPFVQISSGGVIGYVRADSAWTPVRIPFDAIRGVKDEGGALVLHCAPPHGKVRFEIAAPRGMVGTDAEERAHIVAQIKAAAERVRQPSQTEEKASRLEFLRRGKETWTVWLTRLDTVAESLKGAHNYRSLALDEEDLWTAVETPEVDAELRTAAARVLVQAKEPETRTRVESALAAERDPVALKQIRVALETDADEAVRELEEIEKRALARR